MTEGAVTADLKGPLENAKYDARIRRADRLGVFVTSLPKWTALAVIAWQARLSIDTLTGKDGLASLLTRFGRETSYWEIVCWLAGLAGILFGLYSRRLLRKERIREAPQRFVRRSPSTQWITDAKDKK